VGCSGHGGEAFSLSQCGRGALSWSLAEQLNVFVRLDMTGSKLGILCIDNFIIMLYCPE
jgi:hypothetical protein